MSGKFLLPLDFLRDPEARAAAFSVEEARRYTRWLAARHYENFHVVSILLPRALHQDFYNIYAFCRWADDLGDETGSPEESLALLGWWRRELRSMFSGEARQPVFLALRETVERRGLPLEPFEDLIGAFEQDQKVTRYRTFEELYGYCRRSANPVGRLVLLLCGYRDPERHRLSDCTCTALQLANFWQDVAVDWLKGRVYVPLDVLERHGSSVDDIRQGRATQGFRESLREAVEVARGLFLEGLPLVGLVDRRLALDLDLFSRGGLRILDKIAGQDYDVLSRRPAISRVERAGLLLGSLARAVTRRAA